MRLPLIIVFALCAGGAFPQSVRDSIAAQQQQPPRVVDANFLFSYYDQDGNHSAVTGGIGTQKLQDYASKIILNVPLDTAQDLTVGVHVNYYASASTDRINENMASASSSDVHTEVNIAYSKKNISKKTAIGFLAGGSVESDYISGSLGFRWARASKDDNREFSVLALAYFDAWQLIFPDELRETAYRDVSTDKRRTFTASFAFSQILTKRLQGALTTDFVVQHGLLSTPFHRVFFNNSDVARIEKLPAMRLKFPLGIRASYFAGEFLVAKFQYRFYYDNFGIIANTLNTEFSFIARQMLAIAPFYRIHIQSASDYFSEYGQHEPDALFYTSDYDLSAFIHHKVGIGLGCYPQAGNVKLVQERKLRFHYIGIRYANYFRSDGLRAFILSFHVGVKI